MPLISKIRGREILDSRGNPTVEAEIELECGIRTRASVPSGASTGSGEALELRDGTAGRYSGKGVLKAVDNINTHIAGLLTGMDVTNQRHLDNVLLELDGTPEKRFLGANAILAVSLAAAKAAALFYRMPLYRYIGGIRAHILPRPMMNILNAGVHSTAPVDFQEFMIVPCGIDDFPEALRACVEVFHTLKKLLVSRGCSAAVGDEGGFAPDLKSPDAMLALIVEAISLAGYKPGLRKDGGQISLALDCAASEFYVPAEQVYCYEKSPGKFRLDRTEQADLLRNLAEKYPIESIEDGMAESDWEGWHLLNQTLGKKVRLVGDDLLVTNTRFIRKAIANPSANALLVKMNQVGTISETLDAVAMAQRAGWQIIVSHRSGETEETAIADLAVACGAERIKAGSASRGERIVKYNRLLRIAEQTGGKMYL